MYAMKVLLVEYRYIHATQLNHETVIIKDIVITVTKYRYHPHTLTTPHPLHLSHPYT